jgi:glycosyltransferase involved in cell wall biosynthesis
VSDSTTIASVTAVLFCFRQQDVVADAVRALFSQTLQPAEIILSDDASPDDSFDVLQKVAAEYCGPANLVLRRSERNAGWFAHINACLRLASHDHIIVFAGDDVSKPDRIQFFANTIAKKPQARLIWSMMERMTPDGQPTGQIMGVSNFQPGRLRGGVGASQSWHKELLDFFGDLPTVQAAEDIILPFRAWLLGGLIHLPDPLVSWRDRDYRQLNCHQLDWTYEVRQSEFRINAAKVMADDLANYLRQYPQCEPNLATVRARLNRETRSAIAEYEVIRTLGRFARLCKLISRLGTIGFKRSKRLWQDQILGLPAYLESAYSRDIRRWSPRINALIVAALIANLLHAPLSVRLACAVLAMPLTMETTRMAMRLIAKLAWKPERKSQTYLSS